MRAHYDARAKNSEKKSGTKLAEWAVERSLINWLTSSAVSYKPVNMFIRSERAVITYHDTFVIDQPHSTAHFWLSKVSFVDDVKVQLLDDEEWVGIATLQFNVSAAKCMGLTSTHAGKRIDEKFH